MIDMQGPARQKNTLDLLGGADAWEDYRFELLCPKNRSQHLT